MYVLVVATLIISIIGIYAQVIVVQAGRIAASQSSIAKAMLTWHAAASSMGASIFDYNYTNNTFGNFASYGPVTSPTSAAATGCSLTYDMPSAGYPALCPPPLRSILTGSPQTDPSAGPVISGETGTVTGPGPTYLPNPITGCSALQPYVQPNGPHLCANFASTTTMVRLPADYKTTAYQFYSIMFQDAGSLANYVVTFMPPVAPSATNPGGFLQMPHGQQLSVNGAGLMQQFQNLGIAIYSFGTVIPNPLGSGYVIATNGLNYAIPTINGNPIIPTSSVALISATQGM